MIFDEYVWCYIKTFLFNPDDIQRRIRHNKENIRTQLIFKSFYYDRYDLYHKIMEEDSDSETFYSETFLIL